MATGQRSPTAEENDRIILETPVYLSKLLHNKLHIFQHQIRPMSTSLETPVIRSRIKPQLKEVELEFQLDSNSTNFDLKRAAEIACRVDGEDEGGGSDVNEVDTDGNKKKIYERGIMDKLVLKSGPCNLDNSLNYAVGKFHNGELHICPVKSILQLQPTSVHDDISIDEPDKVSEEKVAEEVFEETSPQKVNVKFQRHESDRTKKLKQMSYSYYLKKREEEKWVETKYYPANADESELERLKVICSHPRLDVTGLNVETHQYLKSLVPYTPAENIPIPGSSGMLSVASLKPLNWQEKLRILLLNTKIIQYRKLISLLADEKRPKDVYYLLRALQTQAVMVRGNWIVRSEVMYPESTKSRHNGVPSTVMCRARDYLLSSFNKFKFVGQVKFVNFVKIPREEAKEMLMEIARYHENKGWDLIYPDDNEFMQRFPEITAHQQKMLEEKRNFLEMMYKELHGPSKSPEIPRRQRKKSSREASLAGNESGSDGATPPRRRKKSSGHVGN